jgi:hypothetical protein
MLLDDQLSRGGGVGIKRSEEISGVYRGKAFYIAVIIDLEPIIFLCQMTPFYYVYIITKLDTFLFKTQKYLLALIR